MTNETEPGFGRYADKDSKPGAFWEHTSQGWRYLSHEGDPEPGAWQWWGDVEHFGPFTPIEVPTKRDPLSEERRAYALTLAVQAHTSGVEIDGTVIETARVFEAYLSGGE